MSKDFDKEIWKFIDMIKNDEPYALVRFADGEGSVIDNNPAWLKRRRKSASWHHAPGDRVHEEFRRKLTESLKYNAPNYFIGIPCRAAHQKRFHYLFDYLKDMTTVPFEQLTFATVFKDYNWRTFTKHFMVEAMNKDCYLVANDIVQKPNKDWLDFKDIFRVSRTNAHLETDKTKKEILKYIARHEVKGAVFMFATGPGTNVIIHELWQENRDNWFIDIGSVLDAHTMEHSSPCRGRSRVYLRKDGRGYKPWEWG